MASDTSTTFVGSHEKPENSYGQNGYQGPSSDLPGQATRMDRDFGLKADPSAAPGDWQTRNVSAEPIKPAHGLKARDSKSSIPDSNVRRPTTRK